MSLPPAQPKLYHITLADNLPKVISAGGLWSDAERVRQELDTNLIGMGKIKQRRLSLPVDCHLGTTVGEYVPFYWCPRSVMLFILHRSNHHEVDYHGGQDPIIHLQVDLHAAVSWAQAQGTRWACSVRNAGVEYGAGFFDQLAQLDRIDWAAVQATDFRSPAIREGKQAEFFAARLFSLASCRSHWHQHRGHRHGSKRSLSNSRPPATCCHPAFLVLLMKKDIAMLQFTTGDILTAEAEALVNTVNCVGVMGRGIALQFRKAFPDNFPDYERACGEGALRPGVMLVHDRGTFTNPRYIINFPTKRHWKGKSRIEDIELGLTALVAEVRRRGIRSIAIPPLGCGLGGLDWSAVRPLVVSAFAPVTEVNVLVYEPAGAPEADVMVATVEVPTMTIGRAALIALMRRYLSAVMDPFITLLEIHKLMYFMQETGERLKLTYKAAPYGPYAENLRHVLNRIERHYISGYADGNDDPEKQIEILSGAHEQAEQMLAEHPESLARCERVANLIQGFETPYGMELLSTVHWVATRQGGDTAEKAVVFVHQWSPRKQDLFSADQVKRAWRALESRGGFSS